MYILSIILFIFPQIIKKITQHVYFCLCTHTSDIKTACNNTIDVPNIRSIITTEYINN